MRQRWVNWFAVSDCNVQIMVSVMHTSIMKRDTPPNSLKKVYARNGQPLARVPNLASELVNLARERIHGNEILFCKEYNFKVAVLSKLSLHAQNTYYRNL